MAIDGSSATDLNYSFSLVTPTTSTTPLSLNTPVSSTLAELGEQDIYTFTGTVGQRLYYDALKNDFSDTFSARLVDPTGDIVSLNQDADSDRGPFTLTEAGTYQLVFESASVVNPDTGSYNFQLLDLAAATALNFDTVTTGTLSPGRETDLYRFTGSAGQRLVFDSQTTSTSANWYLYGPTNQQLSGSGSNIITDFELNLPADGTYVLAIDGSSATDLNYSFSLVTPTTSTTPLSLNTPVSSTLAELGEQDIYTFTGTVGQRLYYDALKNDFSDTFSARLVDPTGDIVSLNQDADSDRGPFTLTEAGTYQLVFESASVVNPDTGSYNFQLLDLAAATALNFDTVTTGTLSPGRETDLYRFTGSAGQRLVFDSQTTSTSANWYLYGPTNQQLSGSGSNIITDFELNLPADGTYILAIDGSSATDLNYSFSLVTPSTSLTGSPTIIVNDTTGSANTPIPLNIASSFANSDGNDLRSILISGVPSGATLSAGTNNNNGTWTLDPAQLTGLTITVTSAANFALTVTATSAETTGDTATTAATFSVIVNTSNGITVTPTTGLVTTESGGSATFSVVLDSQPTANVTIGISSSDTTEGTPNVSSLTFTPGNWNIPQTVIVTGVDDNSIDGTVPYTIVTSPATSPDPGYNNLNAADVSVTNTDNDTAGVTSPPPAASSPRKQGARPASTSASPASPRPTSPSASPAPTPPKAPPTFPPSPSRRPTGMFSRASPSPVSMMLWLMATSPTPLSPEPPAARTATTTASALPMSVSPTSTMTPLPSASTCLPVENLRTRSPSSPTPSALPFSVGFCSYTTANGTATPGSDYVTTSGTLNFTGSPAKPRPSPSPSTVTPSLSATTPSSSTSVADQRPHPRRFPGRRTITNDDDAAGITVSPTSWPGHHRRRRHRHLLRRPQHPTHRRCHHRPFELRHHRGHGFGFLPHLHRRQLEPRPDRHRHRRR